MAVLEEKEQQQAAVRAKQEQDNLRRLQQLCRQVETLAAAEQITLKAGMRALRDIRAALDAACAAAVEEGLAGDPDAPRDGARGAWPRVQELREADEWQRWANLQVQEELCGEMEALKDEPDLEVAARRMRELQARWKQVALAPRAQGESMWRRFKAAQDEVFARTAAHFAAQREERAANLAKKQALCERAEALADSSDWVRDGRGDSGAAGRMEDHRPGQPRPREGRLGAFRGACDRFFTRRQEDLKQRKEAWAANLARKEALCAKAEALADSTEWDAAAAQMRQLQAEWKTIGPVRKSKIGSGLAAVPRPACDRFFDRYKHRDQVELAAKAAPRRGRHPRAGSAAARRSGHRRDPPPDGLCAVVQNARARWQQAPELPRHVQQELAVRYHEALGRSGGRLAGRVQRDRSGSRCHPQADGKAARALSRSCVPAPRRQPAARCRRRNCWRSSGASGWPPTRYRRAQPVENEEARWRSRRAGGPERAGAVDAPRPGAGRRRRAAQRAVPARLPAVLRTAEAEVDLGRSDR